MAVIPLLVYLLLMALLISLGRWQLSRSEEKAELLAQQAQRQSAPVTALDLNEFADMADRRYRRVEIEGRFDVDHQFLIDNQMRHGKPGFFVMTPLVPDRSTLAVLVNRGWIPLSAERTLLPDVS
ncbi:MAG: SURF1 family protein, partial [Gammaproteobacteria bacterium]